MLRVASLFSQALSLFPRTEFQRAVHQHQAERYSKGFSCWDQFVAMLFCQLAQARSLREISQGLASSVGKLTPPLPLVGGEPVFTRFRRMKTPKLKEWSPCVRCISSLTV